MVKNFDKNAARVSVIPECAARSPAHPRDLV